MTFDVSVFELEDVAVLTVQTVARDDDLLVEGKPVRITVYGPGSEQAVKALHKAGQKAAIRMQALVRGKLEKNAAATADAERVEKLVAITANIENFPIAGGAAALYANPKLVDIADQVEAFFNEKANFSKPSTASLPSTSGSSPT